MFTQGDAASKGRQQNRAVALAKTEGPSVYFAFSTDDFTPFNVPMPGVPLFYDARDMRLLEWPTLWMFYLALERGKTKSAKTWKAYAEQLLDWLRHCDVNRWNLLELTVGHVGAYRAHMLRTKSVYNRPLEARTINARLNTVARFYAWLQRSNLISRAPFTYEEVRLSRSDTGLLGFTRKDKKEKRNTHTLKVTKRIPKAISRNKLREIRSYLSDRDRLISDWSLLTGMRIDVEILALDKSDVPDVSSLRNTQMVTMRITKTKGLRPRDVLVPIKLLDRTWRYINGERAAVTRSANNPKRVDRHALFLSCRGARLSYKTFWKAFHTASHACGQNSAPHDMRHTFAINRLLELHDALKNNASLKFDPLLVLRKQLGHEDLKSTQIYLESLEINISEIEQSLTGMLDEAD